MGVVVGRLGVGGTVAQNRERPSSGNRLGKSGLREPRPGTVPGRAGRNPLPGARFGNLTGKVTGNREAQNCLRDVRIAKPVLKRQSSVIKATDRWPWTVAMRSGTSYDPVAFQGARRA